MRALVAGAFASACIALLLIAFGVVDGGTVLRPEPAVGAAPEEAIPAPAPAPSARVSAHAAEVREVSRLLRRTPIVSVAGRRRHEIALTFDDGPGPYTLALVHELEHLRVPATFFQIGFMVPLFPAAEHALVANRHFVIGDHTESHPMMGRLPVRSQANQIDADADRLVGHGAGYPHLFRPPYASYDQSTLRLLRRRGMLLVLWTIDSEDYLRPGTAALVRRVVSAARPGAIVLMHDAGGNRSQTIAALPAIVKALRRRHYRFVTVLRLLRDAPPPRHQPKTAGAVG